MKESSSDSDLRRARASLTDSDISDIEELNRDLASSFDSHVSGEENGGESVLQQGTSGLTDSGTDIPNRNLDFTPTVFKFDQYDGANDNAPKFPPFSFSPPNSPTIMAPEGLWYSLAPRTEDDIKFLENFKTSLRQYILPINSALIKNKLSSTKIKSRNIQKIINLTRELKYDALINDFVSQLFTVEYAHEIMNAYAVLFPEEIPQAFQASAGKLAHLFIEDYGYFKKNQRGGTRFKKVSVLLDKIIQEGNRFSNQLTNNYLEKIPFYAEVLFKDYALEQAEEYFKAPLPASFSNKFPGKIKPYLYKLSEDTLASAFYAIYPGHSYTQPVQFDLQLSNADQTILKAHSKEILDALCIEHFLADEQRAITPEYIINELKTKLIGALLTANNETETIDNTADQVIEEVLNEANIKRILETVANDNDPRYARKNLLERMESQLKVQINEKIDNMMRDNFVIKNSDDPNTLLSKIFANDPLSDTELQALLQARPSLQYANNKEDFSLALSAIYPSADYPAAIYLDDCTVPNELFIRARRLLRHQALDAIKHQYPEALGDVDAEDIDTLAAMPWLAAKCRLISGKSITLELGTTEQESFNRQSHRLFHLSELNLAAVTHKSITQLKKELEKLATLKLKLVTQAQQHLVEIESTLLDYPKLIDLEDFEADLNAALTGLSFSDENHTVFQVDTGQAQVLLQGIDRHIAHLDNDWGLFKFNAPQTRTATGVNALSQGLHQRVAPYKNKWNLLLLNPLIEKIYTDIKPTLTLTPNLSESKAKNLIVTAINLLRSCHQLKEKLAERAEWSKRVTHRYALLEKNKICRDEIAHRINILEEMKTEKGALLTNNNPIAISTPGPVYLPSHCHDLNNPAPTQDLQIEGKKFNRRDALDIGQTITYRQHLEGEKQPQEWSITRRGEHSLGYHTKKTWYRKPSEAMQKEVTFTQMIDAVNSFKDNKEITFTFGPTCSQAAEIKYRLFISAYSQLQQESGESPRLRCRPNVKLKMPTEAAVTAAKEEIKHKLALYAHERVAIHKDLSTCSRNRG